MAKFRTRPIVIEAEQWFQNGDHSQDGDPTTEGKVVRYFRRPDVDGHSVCSECGLTFHVHGWIDTREDGHRVCPGDWIITGVMAERYPCKPDVFEATYEEAS